MMNKVNLIGIFVIWCIIGILNLINWISGAPCSWISYFCCWVFLLYMNMIIIRLMDKEDSN